MRRDAWMWACGCGSGCSTEQGGALVGAKGDPCPAPGRRPVGSGSASRWEAGRYGPEQGRWPAPIGPCLPVRAAVAADLPRGWGAVLEAATGAVVGWEPSGRSLVRLHGPGWWCVFRDRRYWRGWADAFQVGASDLRRRATGG